MTWEEILNKFGLPIAGLFSVFWFGVKHVWPFLVSLIEKKEAQALKSVESKEHLLKEQVELARKTAENSRELHQTCLNTFNESRNDFLNSLRDRDRTLIEVTKAIQELRNSIKEPKT